MTSRERRFVVALHGHRTGVLHAKDDYTWFVLDSAYLDDPDRAVLGLRFEQDRKARHAANMRLPPWFSNLLPEGSLRDWIAQQRGVASAREVEVLAEVGHDLPGAVTVTPTAETAETRSLREVMAPRPSGRAGTWRFSLAGVQLKFSMLKKGERFTAPGFGEGGDWIVKLPDAKFPQVPRNELAMMALAARSGIEVPETKLVPRENLASVPNGLWPPGEEFAYAVRRFDRAPHGTLVHMEDMAQVRGFYPDDKYHGTFETVANLVFRGHDTASAVEFVRRITFNALIRNADAHLKNWSLLYRNPRVPVLSPAYDLVATGAYSGVDRDLGLRLGGSRRFEDLTLATFGTLQRRLGVEGVSFVEEAEMVVDRALAAWPGVEEMLRETSLAAPIGELIGTGAQSLRRAR